MTIDDTCCCGAVFRVTDDPFTIAGPRHRDWLAAHAICRATAADVAASTDDTTAASPLPADLGGT